MAYGESAFKTLNGMTESINVIGFLGDYLLPQMQIQDPNFNPQFSVGADASHATVKKSITHIHRLGKS